MSSGRSIHSKALRTWRLRLPLPGAKSMIQSNGSRLVRPKEVHMAGSDPTVLDQAAQWLKDGRQVALATVIETWGSAPQPIGSQLAIDAEGNFIGSVSGGCVEGAVVTEAMDVLGTGKPKVLAFGVADETAWKVGLACGGKIRVYVEPLAA